MDEKLLKKKEYIDHGYSRHSSFSVFSWKYLLSVYVFRTPWQSTEPLLSQTLPAAGEDCRNYLLSRCCATGATQGTVGLEDQSQQGVYSLKGCYKPTVAVGGEATAFHRVPWSVAPSDLLCFPHDTGNNWWKSQLLRVLPKRSLHSDKAAQVLAAQGTHHLLPWVLWGEAALLGCRRFDPCLGDSWHSAALNHCGV